MNHNSAQVDIEGEGVVSLTYKWDLHEPLFEARFGDRTVVVQPLEEVTHGYRVQHIGTEVRKRTRFCVFPVFFLSLSSRLMFMFGMNSLLNSAST